MASNDKLIFKVKSDGKSYTTPRWRKIETENTTCPEPGCGGKLIVMFGPKDMLYAVCSRCWNYFVG